MMFFKLFIGALLLGCLIYTGKLVLEEHSRRKKIAKKKEKLDILETEIVALHYEDKILDTTKKVQEKTRELRKKRSKL